MYRPDGWKNPEEGKPNLYYGRSIVRTSEIFEAGADAMLEALFKLAKESPTGTFIIDSRITNVYARVFDVKGVGKE